MSRRWNEEDDNYLEQNYPKLGVKKCAWKLGRTDNSIANRASVLDLKCEFNPGWNEGGI